MGRMNSRMDHNAEDIQLWAQCDECNKWRAVNEEQFAEIEVCPSQLALITVHLELEAAI